VNVNPTVVIDLDDPSRYDLIATRPTCGAGHSSTNQGCDNVNVEGGVHVQVHVKVKLDAIRGSVY
jgi:hypothetical protein